MKSQWGHNRILNAHDHKRMVLESIQAAAPDKSVPQDLLEFFEKADVVLLDANNQPVAFHRLIVTWSD